MPTPDSFDVIAVGAVGAIDGRRQRMIDPPGPGFVRLTLESLHTGAGSERGGPSGGVFHRLGSLERAG